MYCADRLAWSALSEGSGDVDFPAVVQTLSELGYAGWVVVEQDVLPGMGTPKASAQRNRLHLLFVFSLAERKNEQQKEDKVPLCRHGLAIPAHQRIVAASTKSDPALGSTKLPVCGSRR
jgi:hypothetical protein